ncbi:MAG: type II toxin-antitoxin system VapC family toxin [Candidatus Heimdallarchaeota archaeon]|nr:type II toxin-antitoxin system VapC family toxin [Candidatus Heimdallarchaeota archaeon]
MVKKSKSRKLYLWDTGALFLYFADHSEARTLMQKIESSQARGFIPQLVLVEFFYKTMEKLGKQTAEYQLTILKESKNNIIGIKDNQISEIGLLKLSNRTMSMVDCVVGVLGKQYKTIIITTDGDFDNLKEIKSINLTY